MFILKFPHSYPNQEKIEDPFKDLSLAYKVETDESLTAPLVLEGTKKHEGEVAIEQLLKELQDYYGAHYNCSCAR